MLDALADVEDVADEGDVIVAVAEHRDLLRLLQIRKRFDLLVAGTDQDQIAAPAGGCL
jgi:hypothetical protein